MEDRMEICNEISVNSKRDWKRGANKINWGNAKGREQIFRQPQKKLTLYRSYLSDEAFCLWEDVGVVPPFVRTCMEQDNLNDIRKLTLTFRWHSYYMHVLRISQSDHDLSISGISLESQPTFRRNM
jgi:hypothetical protein